MLSSRSPRLAILASLFISLPAGFAPGFGTIALAQAQQHKPAAANGNNKPAAAPAKTAQGNKPTPSKPAAQPADRKPGGNQALLLASFGDWGAYASNQSKGKICYALSQPKDRLPKNLNRDPAYLFVSNKPGEGVKNEVSIILGFPAKDGGEASATIGSATFALVTQGSNAWVKNPAEEGRFLDTLRKGERLVVKATSKRGNTLTDSYSLSGVSDALGRSSKECQS